MIRFHARVPVYGRVISDALMPLIRHEFSDDLVLNNIFGMGTRVDATMSDMWELYSIFLELRSDGAGGTEPRITFNDFIQCQQDAYSNLKDIAAIFCGISCHISSRK